MAQPSINECMLQLQDQGFSDIVQKGFRVQHRTDRASVPGKLMHNGGGVQGRPGFDANGIAELTAVRSGEVVAVRVHAVSPGARKPPNFLQSIKLSALDHPHVVQPRALIGTPPYLCVVTEHADGGDLFNLVRRAPGGRGLPPAAARFLFQQLMLALDFCHRQSIVIRDLNPCTLLVFWNSRGMPIVKLSDLTLAKDTATQMIRQAAAPDYTWEDLAPVCDVWSAIAILYYLLTGEWPFTVDDVRGWPLQAADKWQFDERVLDKAGLRGEAMEGIREVMRRVFTGGCLTAEEYARDRRPSVQDVMREPWFLADLPGDTAEMQELYVGKTARLQDSIRGQLAPVWEMAAAAALRQGVFAAVEVVGPLMERPAGDEGPFANGPASAAAWNANASIPRVRSTDSIGSSHEVQLQQGDPPADGDSTPADGDSDFVIHAFWEFLTIPERGAGTGA